MNKEIIRNVLKVFAVGITSAFLSAGECCLGYAAYWLFRRIPAANGYYAIASFALALVSVAAALAVVYMSGAWIARKGKFSK